MLDIRLVKEEQRLHQQRLDNLVPFLARGKPDNLTQEYWEDLLEQEDVMQQYNAILLKRISKYGNTD